MRGTTITQVAKRAGVAPSTVSYVLSRNRSISDKTRARVLSAIDELDYKPHAGARSMRAGKTDVVALVVPFYDWASEPVLMPYVFGVVDSARRHGWNVMLVTGGGTNTLEEVLGSKMADRVVLMEVQVDDERLKVIERLAIPAVALGMPSSHVRLPFVDFDFEAAGHLCVKYLVRHGHHHIGLLASAPGTFEKQMGYAHRLWRGVSDALKESDLPFYGLPMEPTRAGVQSALGSLLTEAPGITALISHNEAMTDLLVAALGERGKSIPADISLIVIGSEELTKHVSPPLAHVNIPSVEMGRRAIELLAEQGPGVLLPAALVPGATVAAPYAH